MVSILARGFGSLIRSGGGSLLGKAARWAGKRLMPAVSKLGRLEKNMIGSDILTAKTQQVAKDAFKRVGKWGIEHAA